MTRTIRKSGITLTASLAVLAVGLVGCSSPTAEVETSDDPAKASIGEITVATGTQFPPMGYTDTASNELVGFEIDLGEALAEELGAEIKWEGMKFSQFLSSVETKRVDMILGAMLTTPERLESVTSVEYLSTGFQFSTSPEAAKEHGIKEIADFCGLTVAASRNSSYKASIDEWSAENCDTPIEVLDTDGSPDARLQLKQGRAQGIMQTAETISYLESTESDSFVAIGEPITESFYGMLFSKDNTELRDQLKGALEALIDNGTYADLLEEWGLEAQAMDAPTVELGK